MTIAIGILCQDGVVIAADTEHTGAIKQPGSKVWGIAPDNADKNPLRVALAGAGDSVLLRSARDRVGEAIRDRVRTRQQATTVIERQLGKLYAQHVYPYPNFDGSGHSVRLVLGIRDAKGASLYETSATAMAKVDSFTSVGAGENLGAYILETLSGPQDRGRTMDVGIVLATYVLQQVKKYSLYCGGDSYILTLSHAGELEYIDLEEIAFIEYGISQFERVVSLDESIRAFVARREHARTPGWITESER
jgi:20S proteasome alpha/beta subunit